MTIPSQIALGRRGHDPARLAAVPPHVMAATAPAPAELPRDGLVWTPTLCKNGTLPTCVVAALDNSARVWALLQGFDLPTDEAALLAFFAACASCANTEAAIAATDGLVFLDALERAAVGGFDIGLQAPLVPSFRAINTASAAAFRDAISASGSALIGVTLYQADVQPGAVWRGGLDSVGPVDGGHAICGWRYTAADFGMATWGDTEVADDAWLLSRVAEAYSVTWGMGVA
jgi:hypothetical protein